MVVGGSAELVVRDVVGLREGMDGAEVAAEEGIDEGRLAGVDLTADGEKNGGPRPDSISARGSWDWRSM